MSEEILKVEKLDYSFSRSKPLFNQLSFSIRRGQVFALVGHNGAGKTSLFHLILGFKFADRGTIEIAGVANTQAQSRTRIGYVPERPYLPLDRNLNSYLKYLLKLNADASRSDYDRMQNLLKEFGLSEVANQPLKSFSKGMLQKSMIVQSLMSDPDLVILDEPMSGLDPEARTNLREKILAWKQQGKSVLFSSHALEDVEQLADEVLVLNRGKVEFLGSVTDWKRKQS